MGRQFVLIGSGHTSASAARTLRRLEFDGNIVIVGDEPHAPYQRPPLSKEYLQGESTLDDIWSAPPAWYSDNGVKLRMGTRAVRVNRSTLDVELEDGSRLRADAVLLATGGRPRRFPGVEGDSVLYLRTVSDAERIRKEARPGRRIVIVGGGFIGLEVAASARSCGAEVTVLEAATTPLQRVLGETIGAVCGMIHRDNGVDLRAGVSVDSIEETSQGVVVRTGDGKAVEGDVVVVGIGIIPAVEVAKASEITVGNGIRVDEFCRTSAEGVFAAGDVANHYHPLFDRRMRVEHFDNATRQGTAAAKNMMGVRTQFDDPHWFWSDQYQHSLQHAGHAEQWDDIVVRGSLDDRDFTAFYVVDGKIDAAFAIDRGGEVMVAKSLIARREAVNRDMLQDEGTDLADLVPPQEEERSDATPAPAAAPQARGEFLKAARSGQVAEGIVRRFVVAGVEIAIARSKGTAYAMHNLCTHLACHLASGKVEDDGLVCLCHGSIFDLATGNPINPPATKAVKTYPVLEQDGHIYVSVE